MSFRREEILGRGSRGRTCGVVISDPCAFPVVWNWPPSMRLSAQPEETSSPAVPFWRLLKGRKSQLRQIDKSLRLSRVPHVMYLTWIMPRVGAYYSCEVGLREATCTLGSHHPVLKRDDHPPSPGIRPQGAPLNFAHGPGNGLGNT